jgi:hypothetical protein
MGMCFIRKASRSIINNSGQCELSRNFVLNRRLVNGNTQEFIQGIENVNHGYNLAFATQFKNIHVDLGYRKFFSEQAANRFTTQTPTKLLFPKRFKCQLGLCL